MRLKQLISDRIKSESERVEKARAEFNYTSVEGKIADNSRVLDVGAWSCYLAPLLRDRKRCEVLSLDVVDVHQTDVPFRTFNGRDLPVERESYDVVLLLYVLHHAAEDLPLLRESRRVLRPEGRLLVAEDSVDGLWNRFLTVAFHVWLRVAARMSCDGEFRRTPQWLNRFRSTGFKVVETVPLGHHLGRSLWPRNVLFVLEKDATMPAQ